MDISTIHQRLENCPNNIYSAALDAIEKKIQHDLAKRAIEKAKAAVIIAKGNEAKNQSVLNAYVIMDKGVDEAEAKAIQANADYLMAEVLREKEQNVFDAVKKECNMLEAEMRNFGGRSQSNQ